MTQQNHHHYPESTLFSLAPLGLLKISGQNASQLLQGQLSCDMNTITAGSGIMGAHCNPQGRIISLFYIARIQDDFYLVMPQQLITTAHTALKKYAPFFKAELQDATGSYQLFGTFAVNNKCDASVEIALPAHTNRKIIFMPASFQPSPEASDYHEWKLLDMLEGIPAIYPETSGIFLPHDINLPELNGVSFTKGCFTGQEIIARMHYRGKPKKHLYRGISPEILAPGDELFHLENPAATVIDCAQNVYNNGYPFLLMTDEATMMKQQMQTKHGLLIQLQQSESK